MNAPQLFKPEWYAGADNERLLALKTASGAYWSVEKKNGSLTLAYTHLQPLVVGLVDDFVNEAPC
jgi:hypothetical protein